SGTIQTPSTEACAAPDRTVPESARCPRSRPRAVTTIVFPAPVSPVIAVKPGPSSRTDSSITPSELIRSSSSTVAASAVGLVAAAPLGGAPPAGHRQVELGDQPVGERRLVQPCEAHRVGAPADLDPRAGRQLDGASPVAPEHA